MNAFGRVLPFIPRGSTKKDFVRGSIKRRLEPYDNRIVGVAGDLESGSDVIASILNSQIGDLVGTGINPSIDTGEAMLDRRLGRLWAAWGEDCEATGLTWADAITLACRLWLRDGEAFILTPASGRIQVLNAADLPATPGSQGIDVDPAGRPLSYHFRPGMDEVRVDARDVLHLAHRVNPRQLRGISPLLPALKKIADLQAYDDAEQEAASAAAKVAFVIKSEAGDEFIERDEDGYVSEELPNGLAFDRLFPGESVETIKAHRPNAELSNYRAAVLRAITASTGADYCAVSRDSPGSFSAARHLSVIASRDADARYSQLRRQVLDPLWRWLVEGWARAGQVALTESTRWQAMHPAWRRAGRPDWIDPLKMANAMKVLKESGFAEIDELRQHFSAFGQSATPANAGTTTPITEEKR